MTLCHCTILLIPAAQRLSRNLRDSRWRSAVGRPHGPRGLHTRQGTYCSGLLVLWDHGLYMYTCC